MLTEREVEVLRLVAEGRTNSQIARALGLSPQTIKTHLGRMSLRTGSSSRAGLVGWAFRNGYLR